MRDLGPTLSLDLFTYVWRIRFHEKDREQVQGGAKRLRDGCGGPNSEDWRVA